MFQPTLKAGYDEEACSVLLSTPSPLATTSPPHSSYATFFVNFCYMKEHLNQRRSWCWFGSAWKKSWQMTSEFKAPIKMFMSGLLTVSKSPTLKTSQCQRPRGHVQSRILVGSSPQLLAAEMMTLIRLEQRLHGAFNGQLNGSFSYLSDSQTTWKIIAKCLW